MIHVYLEGESVTPQEAAKALNVTGGAPVLIRTGHNSGPEVKVYPKFCGSRGIQSPWVSCPTFTADTVEQAREGAHVLSTAADLLVLAELLADDPAEGTCPGGC